MPPVKRRSKVVAAPSWATQEIAQITAEVLRGLAAVTFHLKQILFSPIARCQTHDMHVEHEQVSGTAI